MKKWNQVTRSKQDQQKYYRRTESTAGIKVSLTEVEKWISLRLGDNNIVRPTAFAVSPPFDSTTQFPCHICGKLGHCKADCPQNESSKTSGEKT